MSSELPHYYYDDVEHLSSSFQRLGCEYSYSQVSHQNGWVGDSDDLDEEDVWGGHDTYGDRNDAYGVNYEDNSHYGYAMENGHTSRSATAPKSRLSMELQAGGGKDHKKGRSGLGFADLDTMQNGSYGGSGETSGGWAPGFSVRKVRLPLVDGGEGCSGYANGWYDSDIRGNRGGVPQSAPVSMPVWPVKSTGKDCNAGYVDADDSSPEDCGDENQDSECSDDDNESIDADRRRLAPHEIVDREYARSRSTTFSVIEGAGRTLKGSDLRRVRNAVWSRTGFED